MGANRLLACGFLSLIQLVHLRGDNRICPPVVLQPLKQLEVGFHPSAPRVQQKDAKRKRLTLAQISFYQLRPPPRYRSGGLRISISRQIDEVISPVHLEKIHRLGPARRARCERQPGMPCQLIQKRGLPNIRPAQKCNLGQSLLRELLRRWRAQYELGRRRQGVGSASTAS